MNAPDRGVTAALTFATLPAIGQPLDGGLFAGLTTLPDGKHCAVVLLGDKPEARMTWDAATQWAEALGAQLPGRPVAALLFANLRGEFDEAWHWTNESHEDDGACAWGQNFNNGFQLNGHKSYEGRARAVRLIPLSA